MNTHKLFNLVMALVFAFSLLGMPASVFAQIPSPIIAAEPATSFLWGRYWTPGATISITIEDPYTQQYPDFVTTQNTDSNGDINYQSPIDLSIGSVISVTDTEGNITKQVTVSNFEIDSIDWLADTVSGVGTPNSNAAIWVMNPNAQVPFVIGPSGNWQIDLTGIADFTPMSSGWAMEQDIDMDGTQSNWEVPKIRVDLNDFMGYGLPDQDNITGRGWPIGHTVNLTIDDLSTPSTPDYSSSQVSEMAYHSGSYYQTEAWFNLGGFDLKTGFTITMTDGFTEKTHVVLPIDITELDFAADILRGTADRGSEVTVRVWGEIRPNTLRRTVTADANGDWEADFSTPGDQANEQETYDLQSVQHLWADAHRYDDDRDETRLYGQGLSSSVVAYSDGYDIVVATDFVPGTEVTMTIDDPANGVGIDITRTGVIRSEYGGLECQWGHCFLFDLRGEFHVHAGQLITMTDGSHTYTHTVTPLWITAVDNDESTVSGIADPLSDVYLDAWPCASRLRHVVADANGNWFEDFSIPGDEDFEQATCDFTTVPWEGVAYERSGEGETWVGFIDTDGDWIADRIDNAPLIFNPDQRDIDSDGIADVLDPCPDDETNTCDINDSVANVIGEQGGAVATPNGKVSLNIPVGSIHEYTSFTITDKGGGYELASDQGPMLVVHSYSVQPHGTHFDPPASITLRWDDANDDGVVDSTTEQESNLRLIKDGLVLTPACSANPNCNMPANELTVQISDLSLFALAVPKWTLKGFYQPVDMNGVYNIIKNGSTVPFKFEIFAGSTELTNTADVESLTPVQVSCDTSAPTDQIETTVSGGTSLSYDAVAGQFIYNWKTPKTAGKCYRVTMTTLDGSLLVAYFKLK